jgi:hypothetical protein
MLVDKFMPKTIIPSLVNHAGLSDATAELRKWFKKELVIFSK